MSLCVPAGGQARKGGRNKIFASHRESGGGSDQDTGISKDPEDVPENVPFLRRGEILNFLSFPPHAPTRIRVVEGEAYYI